MRARSAQCLDAAWAEGIRYFDAARSYGLAEDFLASWLRERAIAPVDVAVGSKWGYYYNADWRIDLGGEPHEIKEHSRARLDAQVEESAALLGNHLRLYQIHSATFESGVLSNSDVLDALAALKAERGWRLGLSLSGPAQAEVLRAALKTGLFDSCQATYNLLEPSVGVALAEARAAGLEVIVKEAMANGRVLCAPPLIAAARELGATPDALALACAMVQPFEPMVLSGAVTVEQVRSNAAAIPLARTLDPACVRLLLDEMAMDPAEYWAERSQLAWN